jgi:hypothetical protein
MESFAHVIKLHPLSFACNSVSVLLSLKMGVKICFESICSNRHEFIIEPYIIMDSKRKAKSRKEKIDSDE